MNWDEFERALCYAILFSAAHCYRLTRIDQAWVTELERQFLTRWPVEGVHPPPPTRQPPRARGATSQTASPSFEDLPPTHPLKRFLL